MEKEGKKCPTCGEKYEYVHICRSSPLSQEPAKDGDGGMEERFEEKYKELVKNAMTIQGAGGLISSAIPTKRVLELKDFIASEISLAEERLVARILEKKVYLREAIAYVLVEDIVSTAKGEE